MLGVEHTVIESVELETGKRAQEVPVTRVRVKAGAAVLPVSAALPRVMTPAPPHGAGGA